MKLIKSHSEDVYNVTKIIFQINCSFEFSIHKKKKKNTSCFSQQKLIISEAPCVIEDLSNGC